MSQLSIHLDNHGQKYTVSEMRRRLAQMLSKLQGDQIVTFSFDANFQNYRPAFVPPQGAVMGELARPEND